MVDRRLQTATTDLVIDAGDAVGTGCGSFVWSTAKKAAELRVEEGGTKLVKGGAQNCICEGAVLMSAGRHQWSCELEHGARIGVVQDGSITNYSHNMAGTGEGNGGGLFVMYSTSANCVWDCLTGGPFITMQGEIGRVSSGVYAQAGVILDFDHDFLQFTFNGVPAGRRVNGICDKQLRACVSMFTAQSIAKLLSYNHLSVAVPVAEAPQSDEAAIVGVASQPGAAAAAVACAAPPAAPPTAGTGASADRSSSSSDEE